MVALLTGAGAAMIWFISTAHGHGLAAGDARAVWMLTIVAVVAGVGAVTWAVRRS